MGEWSHQPVLRQEVVELLIAATDRPKLIVDCTAGLGGHSLSLLEAAGPEARLIGMDVDECNLEAAMRRLDGTGRRFRLFRANFTEIRTVLAEAGETAADVLLADLGVASTQLDDPGRGLSFATDGPLDMRLDDRIETTATELVNSLPQTDLANLIYEYGEERYSRRIARAIVAARKRGRITRTAELADLVRGAYPAAARRSRRGVHPATRTFQALRIAVNEELEALEQLLAVLPNVVAANGRAGIISFHSLEDRRVKRAFRDLASDDRWELLTKKPVVPGPEETETNPRSRSAKLRGIHRVA